MHFHIFYLLISIFLIQYFECKSHNLKPDKCYKTSEKSYIIHTFIIEVGRYAISSSYLMASICYKQTRYQADFND